MGLYDLSRLFLVPVVVLILAALGYVALAGGMFAVEFVQRRRGTYRSPLAAYRAATGAGPQDIELWILRRLELLRIISRTSPMLGLIATMIPMGPGAARARKQRHEIDRRQPRCRVLVRDTRTGECGNRICHSDGHRAHASSPLFGGTVGRHAIGGRSARMRRKEIAFKGLGMGNGLGWFARERVQIHVWWRRLPRQHQRSGDAADGRLVSHALFLPRQKRTVV
jgi:hypothetical protein